MKKKIFHLITSLNYGGTERFLYTILKNFRDDYQFAVGYLKERGPIADEIEELGIPVFQVKSVFFLYRYLLGSKPDIVHTHLYRANILGRMAAHAAKIKRIISSQRAIDDWKKWYHVWLDRWTARYVSAVIANSKAVLNLLVSREKISLAKIHVVYNSFHPENGFALKKLDEIRKDLNLAGSEQVVGTITRFHQEKGVDYIPDIVRQVVKKKPNTVFLLVGDGPAKEEVKRKICAYGLEKQVKFIGFQQKTSYYYHVMNIFFLPSREESFPQALLDALGFGIPSVAVNVGGVKELIQPEETGILVPPYNPGKMAEAILWMLDHTKEAEAKAHIAQERVIREFGLNKMLRQIEEVYTTNLSS